MSREAIGEAARQLPLPFAETEHFEEADFLAAPSNAAARAWLGQEGEWPERRLWLWGEGGCGKSHLLHLWARRAGAVVLRGPLLRGLPVLSAAAVAVDDADAVAEEQALLHLLNVASEARRSVLLAGRSPPGRWAVRLPDLA
ncbi:MAG: chromosomal replication initiator DnaA, partial [Acetobacteraceae bacterium]